MCTSDLRNSSAYIVSVNSIMGVSGFRRLDSQSSARSIGAGQALLCLTTLWACSQSVSCSRCAARYVTWVEATKRLRSLRGPVSCFSVSNVCVPRECHCSGTDSGRQCQNCGLWTVTYSYMLSQCGVALLWFWSGIQYCSRTGWLLPVSARLRHCHCPAYVVTKRSGT